MTEKMYYLREEVYLEPLIHNWYAWPYMVPPITSALLFSNRLSKLMSSFVQNHKLHISASKNKKLAGGNFVNCTEEQLIEIKLLLEKIEVEYNDYSKIRDAFIKLNQHLEENALGYSLENEYIEIPEILRGYVELVYNENHNAFIRFIEGLLYKSPLYRKEAQSISLGLLSKVHERPFVLSTPRLADKNHLNIDIQFAHTLLDDLSSLRESPRSMNDILELFNGNQLTGGLTVGDLITTEIPSTNYKRKSGELNIRFLGHAGLCMETDDICILIDPIIPSRCKEQKDDFFSFSDLPENIDYICVTHTHMDHVCLETLLQLRYKTKTIVVPKNNGGTITDPSLKLMLTTLGFNVIDMEDMEVLGLKSGNIMAIPFLGEHGDLNIRSKTAWLIELQGKKIFVAADSSNLDEVMYRNIHSIVGDLDILYIGMECVGAPMSWLYGAFFFKQIPSEINHSRRFNGSAFATAKMIVEQFKPKEVYIYALALEPYFNYFMGLDYSDDSEQIIESGKLLDYCQNKGIQCERLAGSRTWSI